jgi:hypothetical protein
MDRTNKAIIALTAISVILLAVFVFVHLNAVPVSIAGSMQASGGDYHACMVRTMTEDEAIWILDTRSKNIGIYQYDNAARRLELRRVFPAGSR